MSGTVEPWLGSLCQLSSDSMCHMQPVCDRIGIDKESSFNTKSEPAECTAQR